jgi:hypothetical protein
MMAEHPAEERPVDAYCSYLMQMSEARASELRREAAEYAMAKAARAERGSLWARAFTRLRRRQAPVLQPARTIELRTRATGGEPPAALRRSA